MSKINPIFALVMILNLAISLPLITCALFSMLILLEWCNRQLREQHTLFAFMLTATLLYVGHYIYFNRAADLLPLSDILYVSANLTVYPLYLIYIIRLTSKWRAVYWLMLLPGLLAIMATGTGYIFMTDEEDRMFVHNYLYHNSQTGLTDMALFQAYIRQFCKLVFAIEVIATVVIGSMMIRRYDRMVDEFYADTDDKSMRNIQSILYLVLTIAILSFIVNIIGRARFTDHEIILTTTSLMFSALLFAIGYEGLHRHFSIIDMRTNKEQVSNDDSAALKDAVNRSMTERIIALVENDKIYLQPDLKLDDLAQMMHTNRTYIYQAVNQQMGISFNEFINRYRIAHAKRLSEHEEVQLTQNAFSKKEVGHLHLGSVPLSIYQCKKVIQPLLPQ